MKPHYSNTNNPIDFPKLENKMNERIRELAEQAGMYIVDDEFSTYGKFAEKFAELIVEECRTVVVQVYRATPLELCGPLLTADEEIQKLFYGVAE
jgi:hypothetical protein